jgi:hypothetical protein
LGNEIFNWLSEHASCYSLDDINDRVDLANKLAEWLTSDKTHDFTIEMLLPKAEYRAGLNVVDERTGQPIIGLVLNRSRWMSDGDWLAMQNYFWTVIGKAIRYNPSVISDLRTAGITVTIPDAPSGGQPGAL